MFKEQSLGRKGRQVTFLLSFLRMRKKVKVILQTWGHVSCMIRTQTGLRLCIIVISEHGGLCAVFPSRSNWKRTREAQQGSRERDKQTSTLSAMQTSKAWWPHRSAGVFTTETAGNAEGFCLILGDTRATTEQTLISCWTFQEGLSSLSSTLSPCFTSFIALNLALVHFVGRVSPGALLRSAGIWQTEVKRTQLLSECLAAIRVHSSLRV